MSTATRPYRMQARAAAVEDATERILDAAEELFWQDPAEFPTLRQIADRAGVSVHSIIRRFGGVDGVSQAAMTRSIGRVSAQRDAADPADLSSVVAAIVEHYEQLGDRVLTMLAMEQVVPGVGPLVERGRELHVDWCRRMFAGALEERQGSDRKRLLAQLVAVCDVYMWALLRRQRGLGRSQTELALFELIEPLVNGRSS
jgi:AcrR family transcriptional regulator